MRAHSTADHALLLALASMIRPNCSWMTPASPRQPEPLSSTSAGPLFPLGLALHLLREQAEPELGSVLVVHILLVLGLTSIQVGHATLLLHQVARAPVHQSTRRGGSRA